MATRKFNLESAIRWYNDIVIKLGYEHHAIGDVNSEGTEDWNLRDMVAEIDYILSCYHENGHILGDMRYGDADERRMWRNETGRLKRFLEVYVPHIEGLVCTTGHCSKYDNRRIRLASN